MQSGLASSIRFHGKRFAWFVSDVTKQDWEWLVRFSLSPFFPSRHVMSSLTTLHLLTSSSIFFI